MKKMYLLATIPFLLLFGAGATFYFSGYEVGPGGTYTYRVEERKDGAIEAKIQVIPLLGSVAMQKYEQANAARVKALVARGGDPIEVQVTLRRPLPAEEVRSLATSVGLTVKDFLLVGKGPNAERVTSIINADLSKIPEEEVGPRGQSIKYLGVMILRGIVAPTPEGLGKLANDPRVYLADTTPAEVRDLIQHSPRWSGKAIESVSVPSPFWELAWGQ